MEPLSLTPTRRLQAHRAYDRRIDAFDAVAWRPPSAVRFDGHPANDVPEPEPTLARVVRGVPGWVTVIVGGAVAGLLGAMLGGMLHI